MNFLLIAKNVAKKVTQTVVRYSPQILTTAGIGTSIGAIVVACKKTKNMDTILEDHNAKMNNTGFGFSKKELTFKEKSKITLSTTGKILRNYAGAISLELVSLTCFLSCFGVLKARIAAIAAAAKATELSFRRYRENVIESEGPEKDKEYLLGVKQKLVNVKDPKTGKIKKKNVYSLTKKPSGQYVRLFNRKTSSKWNNCGIDYNLATIQLAQELLNMKLQQDGFVTFNEALEALGLAKDTEYGLVTGWRYYSNGNNPHGDNYIDIGMYRVRNQENLVHSKYEDEFELLLNFNCDGCIIGKDEELPFDPDEEALSRWIERQEKLINKK